jgi:hypothetical protein
VPDRWVTVEKRKWDGQVSARWRALLTAAPPDSWRWCSPAGTPRERPWRDRTDVLRQREVSVGGLGHWLLTVRLGDDGRPEGAEADAILPVQESAPGLVSFVDLDLDLELDLDGGGAALQDLDDFRERAASMGYPPWVQRAAWKGLWDLKRRLAGGRWPFGGALEDILAAAMRPAPADAGPAPAAVGDGDGPRPSGTAA